MFRKPYLKLCQMLIKSFQIPTVLRLFSLFSLFWRYAKCLSNVSKLLLLLRKIVCFVCLFWSYAKCLIKCFRVPTTIGRLFVCLFYSLEIKFHLQEEALSCSKTIITEDETRGQLQQTTATIRKNRENWQSMSLTAKHYSLVWIGERLQSKPCNEQFFAVVSSLENVEQKTLKKS